METPLASCLTDMDWYNGTVYWTDMSGRIHYVELTDGTSGVNATVVPGAVSAGVVAFEWLGKQLYWSCNSTQVGTEGHCLQGLALGQMLYAHVD